MSITTPLVQVTDAPSVGATEYGSIAGASALGLVIAGPVGALAFGGVTAGVIGVKGLVTMLNGDKTVEVVVETDGVTASTK